MVGAITAMSRWNGFGLCWDMDRGEERKYAHGRGAHGHDVNEENSLNF